MRITKIENQPRIALTLKEAKQIKEALEDYNFLCSSSCGFASPYASDNEQLEELINRLDETILKAEAMQPENKMKTLPQRLKQDLKEGKTTLHEAAVRMHIAGFFNFVDEEGTKKYLENEKD